MSRKIVILILVALTAAVGVWFFAGGGLSGAEIRNVILISIDTCRADHLGCYGYPRKITPNIDALAKEAVVFENAICSVPITLPSHTTMLTGTTSLYHRVHDNTNYYVGEYNESVAEILAASGYETGAVVSTAILDSGYGLDRGFGSYSDDFGPRGKGKPAVEQRGGRASRLAGKWLAEHGSEKFFLFLHYYDPHLLYDPPEPFATIFRDEPYAGEIAYVDYCIGRLVEKLKLLGLYDKTAIIITADHGEMLGEHGEKTHAYFVYQSAIKVPLIIKLPGSRKGRRIGSTVGLVDIAPTICGLLGVGSGSAMQGKDLSGYVRGTESGRDERYFYCESLVPTKYGCNPLLAVVAGRWKYIDTTRPELYDLTSDPGERENLIEKEPKRANFLRQRLHSMLSELSYSRASSGRVMADAKTIQQLESLGYVAGVGVDERFESDPNRADAKDFIDFHNTAAAINIAFNNGRPDRAKLLCKELLARKSDFALPYYYLGKIAYVQGDNKGAFDMTYRYIEGVDPNWAEPNRSSRTYAELAHRHCYLNTAHIELGGGYMEQGRYDKAVFHYEQALLLGPRQSRVHDILAVALTRQGRLNRAISHWRKALEIDPAFAGAHYNLAGAFRLQARFDDAIAEYERALALAPEFKPRVFYRLGQIYYQLKDRGGAVRYWSEALRIQPDSIGALDGLARLYATGTGEFSEPNRAVVLAEKACEISGYKVPSLVKTLAVAYAASGRNEQAVATAEKAIALAKIAGDDDLVKELREKLDVYRKESVKH